MKTFFITFISFVTVSFIQFYNEANLYSFIGNWESFQGEIINVKFNENQDVIRPYNKPITKTGGVVGLKGNAGQANYSASKAGVIGFSKSVALELGSRNIRSNVIAPGFIETAMTEKINDEYKNQLKSKIPMDRFGTPQDIANCAAFLCSDLSNYITGETIHVNGGMYFS